MLTSSKIKSWLKSNRRSLLSVAGIIILASTVAIVVPSILSSIPNDKGVVAEWNDTIARLGIDPVFPPEEDIYVGDLFAVITVDRRTGSPDARGQPLLNRAIKLTRLDMKAELAQTYGALPVFPDTDRRPENPNEPWPQKVKEGLFNDTGRGALALAAFPGFTIRHERSTAGGLSAWAGIFGASQQESDLVEVKIPFAETYGIPSLLAAGRLARYCADPFSANVCTDATLRRHLSYVTPGVYDTETDSVTGKSRYLVDVEIALVNRVYLTRSIEQSRKLGRNGAAVLQALNDATSKLKPETAPPNGSSTSTTPSATTGVVSSQGQVQDLIGRLDTLVPGGVLSLVNGSNSQYELKQIFQRPIVIGYRAVRSSFPTDLERTNYTAAQRGQQ